MQGYWNSFPQSPRPLNATLFLAFWNLLRLPKSNCLPVIVWNSELFVEEFQQHQIYSLTQPSRCIICTSNSDPNLLNALRIFFSYIGTTLISSFMLETDFLVCLQPSHKKNKMKGGKAQIRSREEHGRLRTRRDGRGGSNRCGECWRVKRKSSWMQTEDNLLFSTATVNTV